MEGIFILSYSPPFHCDYKNLTIVLIFSLFMGDTEAVFCYD
ncbi:hypothetical protein MTBPR1_30193 [Candidatus Terasakiella magnetica]|uniref:Uncharacterized protein n=1 Tax=Candidatus Terasakiella magnetica TaxID=1867952 RepID=A0A1C3RHR1_9PROT|nr:hypothetical protein MTBPR1_30193 [Candidatus Terasakiella magnetica]